MINLDQNKKNKFLLKINFNCFLINPINFNLRSYLGFKGALPHSALFYYATFMSFGFDELFIPSYCFYQSINYLILIFILLK